MGRVAQQDSGPSRESGARVIAILALLLAAPTDTLRLGPGVHPGPLVLSRPTVVIGAPGSVIRGTGKGSVVDITAPGTVLRGLRIEHGGRDLDQDDAGVMVRADSVLLEDLVIRDILHGVYLKQVRGGTIRRVDIEGPRGLSEGQMGNGIHLFYSRNVRIEANRIAGVRDGIYYSYSDSVGVRHNRISHVRFGLHFMFSHDNVFERNVFSHNAAGAVIMNSNGLLIEDNVFAWNTGGRSFGLVLQTATDPTVRGNLFVGNGIGTFFDNVIHGRYTGNLLAANWLGLQLFTNSEDTEITGNALVDNTFDASGGPAAGAYSFCERKVGNYWSKARLDGYDLDGDGVLDQPYAASSPLAELARGREGLRVFLQSPAAGVLDWAERTFPVFDFPEAVDSCPMATPPALTMMSALPDQGGDSNGGDGAQLAVAAASAAAAVLLLMRRRRERRWRSRDSDN